MATMHMNPNAGKPGTSKKKEAPPKKAAKKKANSPPASPSKTTKKGATTTSAATSKKSAAATSPKKAPEKKPAPPAGEPWKDAADASAKVEAEARKNHSVETRGNEWVDVPLSPDEKIALGNDVAIKFAEIERLEVARKQSADNFKAQIEILDSGIRETVSKIRAAVAPKYLAIVTRKDWRTNTFSKRVEESGVVFFERPLEAHERQLTIADTIGAAAPMTKAEKREADRKAKNAADLAAVASAGEGGKGGAGAPTAEGLAAAGPVPRESVKASIAEFVESAPERKGRKKKSAAPVEPPPPAVDPAEAPGAKAAALRDKLRGVTTAGGDLVEGEAVKVDAAGNRVDDEGAQIEGEKIESDADDADLEAAESDLADDLASSAGDPLEDEGK